MSMAAKLVSNGGWTWFNWPVATYNATDKAIYHGWIDTAGDIRVGKYSTSYQLEQESHLHTALQVDDHANPAILRLANGKILVVYGVQQGSSYCRLSANAGDIRSWGSEVTVSSGGNDTYALIFQTGDSNSTIFWFFGRGTPPNRPRWYRYSTNSGATWTTGPTNGIFYHSGYSSYSLAAQNPSNSLRIDFTVTPAQVYTLSTNSVYHFYMLLDSGGTFYTLYKSDDTVIGAYNLDGSTHSGSPPSLPLDTSSISLVYDGTPAPGWIWDIAYVNSVLTIGYVVFTTTTNTNDTHQYCRATLSSGTWSTETICYAGDSHSPGTVGRLPQWIYPDSATSGETAYSGGLRLDRNVTDRVYVGKKFANGDVRIEQWDKSGGVWAYTQTVSGATGVVNARPFAAEGAPSTQLVYWSGTYTTYGSYATDVWAAPTLSMFSTKTAATSWTSGIAPPGVLGYYLLNEASAGSGATISDVTGSYNGVVVGSGLTVQSETYGNDIKGFSTANYISFDSLASVFSSGSATRWIAVLYKSTDTTTDTATLISLGSSGGTNSDVFIALNQGATANKPSANWKDSSGTNAQATVVNSAQSNGSWHVLMCARVTSSDLRLYLDGASIATAATTVGSFTSMNQATIGCLRRSTITNGLGSNTTIGAVVIGTGATTVSADVDFLAWSIAQDLLGGQFGGTRGLIGGSPLLLALITGEG